MVPSNGRISPGTLLTLVSSPHPQLGLWCVHRGGAACARMWNLGFRGLENVPLESDSDRFIRIGFRALGCICLSIQIQVIFCVCFQRVGLYMVLEANSDRAWRLGFRGLGHIPLGRFVHFRVQIVRNSRLHLHQEQDKENYSRGSGGCIPDSEMSTPAGVTPKAGSVQSFPRLGDG